MVVVMRIGKYRHRITIRNAKTDANRDTFGRRKGAQTTVCTVWAEKTDWTGDEATENGREAGSLSTKWKIRYRTDITQAMQIVHGSDVYDITAVLDWDGTKRELLLTSRKALEV